MKIHEYQGKELLKKFGVPYRVAWLRDPQKKLRARPEN